MGVSEIMEAIDQIRTMINQSPTLGSIIAGLLIVFIFLYLVELFSYDNHNGDYHK